MIEAQTRTRKVKVDEFFQQEFEERSSGEPPQPPVRPPNKRSWMIGAATAFAFSAAVLIYFFFLSPAGERGKEQARDIKKQIEAEQKNRQNVKADPTDRKRRQHPRRQVWRDKKAPADKRQKTSSRSSTKGNTRPAERTDVSGRAKEVKKESRSEGRVKDNKAEINWAPLLNKRPADLSPHQIEADETHEEDLAFTHNQRAIELFGEQKYAEALEEFEAASSESPDREEIVINVLNTLLTMGYDALSEKNYNEARDAFGKALDYDPNDPFAQKALGITSLLLESYEDASHHLELALEVSEDEVDKEILLGLGRAYAITNQSNKAIKYFEEYLKLVPSDSQIRRYLDEIKGG